MIGKNIFVFLFLFFLVQISYASGKRDEKDTHSSTWKYFEANENVEKVIAIDEEHFPRISVLLYLKSGLEFSFKGKYIEQGKYIVTRIYGFGKYKIYECSYNIDTNQYFGIKNDYDNIIKTDDAKYIMAHAEDYEKLIETLPEHSGERINYSHDEDAKEFFDSLPGEAVQLDENRWVKYIKVKDSIMR